MKRIGILFLVLGVWCSVHAQNITAIEYFFDADPGYGSGTSVAITPATTINNLTFNASVTAISDGFHTLTVRARDANNRWSHAFTRPFYKLSASAVTAAPNITKLEYFFDNDPGYGAGINVPITPGTSINSLNVTASLASVADGFHIISFRAQDATGKWSHVFNRPFYKLPYFSCYTSCNYIIIRSILLENQVHGLNIVLRMTPVPTRIEIADIQHLLQAEGHAGNGARDLARHEGLPADRALMVEQDAVAREHVVRLAVIDRDPVGIELGHAVGRAWIEWRFLRLRDLLHLAVEFGRRSLVDPGHVRQAQQPHGLEDAQGADAVDIGRVLGLLEAHLDMRHGAEIVDLVGLYLLDDPDDVGRI